MSTKLDPKVAKKVMIDAGFKPLEPYKSALSKWKCIHINCGEIVYPKYNAIQSGRGGCKSCGHIKTGDKSRLITSELNRRLLKKKLTLIGNYATVGKPIKVKCMICLKTSTTTLDTLSKKSRGNGCETCVRKAGGLILDNDAVEKMISKGLKPLGPYKGYKEPWLCECLVCHKQKRISREAIRRRSKNFIGCIECAKIAQNKKRIDDSKEEILNRFSKKDLEILSEYRSASLPVEVRCKTCNYKFKTTGAQISRQKYSCAKCSGNYVDPTQAKKFMIDNGYIPKNEFPGSHRPWSAIHVVCGNQVKPSYSTIKMGAGGCKHCAKYGFQYSKPAYLYLITNESLNSHKIGIANPSKIKKSDRLHRYLYHGWNIHKVWNFELGETAEKIENLVLINLRIKKNIPVHLTKKEMAGQGGHTETISADSISLLELEKIVNKAIRELKE